MDIDTAVFIADMDEKFRVIKEDQDSHRAPDWWYIGQGLEAAKSEQHFFEAKVIFKQFVKFCINKDLSDKTFKQLTELFTLAKMRGL